MHCKEKDKSRISTDSILRLILRNTYSNDLLGLLDTEENIKNFAAYADDLYIFISDNSRRIRNNSKNTIVRNIYNWCQRYKITMSLQSTDNSVCKNTKEKANKAGNILQ